MSSLPGTILAASAVGGFAGWLISFVIWLLILVWIYNIARRKGRHAFGWVFLGLFFSVFVLIIVALLPSKRTTRNYERY